MIEECMYLSWGSGHGASARRLLRPKRCCSWFPVATCPISSRRRQRDVQCSVLRPKISRCHLSQQAHQGYWHCLQWKHFHVFLSISSFLVWKKKTSSTGFRVWLAHIRNYTHGSRHESSWRAGYKVWASSRSQLKMLPLYTFSGFLDSGQCAFPHLHLFPTQRLTPHDL